MLMCVFAEVSEYYLFLQSDDSKLRKAAKILERMVHQNIFDDIAQGLPFKTC